MKTKTLLDQLLLVIVLSVSFQICNAEVTPLVWQKTFGGNQNESAQAIDATSDGGSVVAGSTTSSNSGDVGSTHGMSDYWIIRLGADGQILWKKILGGTGDDQAQAVKQTADHGFIIAGYSSSPNGDVTGNHGLQDFWIVKLDSTGNLKWQKSYGGTDSDVPYALDITDDGGCIVVGDTYSSNGDITGNHSSGDYWIIKLDMNGNLQWQKAYGGTAFDFAHAVAHSNDGGYIVSGYARSVDGNVILNHGQEDMWILKLDHNGNIVWQESFGGTGGEGASSAAQTIDGGFILTGVTHSYNVDVVGNHGVHDFWIVKIDSIGNLQWKECVGGSETDDGNCIRQTADRGYIVTGLSDSHDGNVTQNHGGHDFWIVKLRENGSVQWQQSLGGSLDEQPYGIAQTTDGAFEAAGYTYSNNGDVSGNHDGSDFWVTKISSPADEIFYADEDGDGYGDQNNSFIAASVPSGYVADFSDCDDHNPAAHPGAADICNGIDDDCDSYTDEDGIAATITPLASVTICTSSVLTLTCNTPGTNLNYQWQRDGRDLDGATNSTCQVTTGGSYWVIVSNGTCTSNSPATIVKTISPLASVTPSGIVQVCQKAEVSFTVPQIAEINYQWYSANGIIPGATSQKYTTSAPGTYHVTESDIAGCAFNSSSATLQNYAATKASIAVLGDLSLCTTGSVTLNALKKIGYTYLWYKDNKAISGATNTSYVATQAGAYKYLATTSNGCTAFSATKNVSGCKETHQSSIGENNYSLRTYPNPSHGTFNLEFNLEDSYSGQCAIRILNSIGQVVNSQSLEASEGAFSSQVSLPDDIHDGIYFVQIVADQKEYSSSIVITR